MRIITAFSFCTGLFLLFLLRSPDNDVVMSSANIPAATQAQKDDFKTTNELLMGVKANDPVSAVPEQKFKDKWYMLTWDKRNVAGVFNRYGTEEEVNNAYDWNLMIDPFDEYKYVYEQALLNPCKTRAEWPGCIDYAIQLQRCKDTDYNNHYCFWAEISPYHYFLNTNKWFKGTHDDHCKEGEFLKRGDTLAVYGFPVADKAHGYNPEIHPAQQIWFRYKEKTNKQKNTYFLFFIQDASDRFGNWTASPIYGQFLVPFKAKPSAMSPGTYEPVTMNVKIAEKYDLVTKNYPAYSQDADDGYSHALVVDGKKLVVVNEGQSEEENKGLGIKFTDIVKLPDGTIQGYVQISMVLGDYDTDPIGVCVLELEVVKAKFTAVANPRPN
ncbi:MAG: hypothetical protein V9F01_00565 [Chitinophagaceae bacterium]